MMCLLLSSCHFYRLARLTKIVRFFWPNDGDDPLLRPDPTDSLGQTLCWLVIVNHCHAQSSVDLHNNVHSRDHCSFCEKSALAKESWAIMRGVMMLVFPSQSKVRSLALMICCFVMVILFFVCFVIFADMREYGFVFLWCRCAARLINNRINTLSHGNLEQSVASGCDKRKT